MADETATGPIPTLEDWQHWTWVMGRAQQMLMESWADGMKTGQPWPQTTPPWGAFPPAFGWGPQAGSPQPAPPDLNSMFTAGARPASSVRFTFCAKESKSMRPSLSNGRSTAEMPSIFRPGWMRSRMEVVVMREV